MSAAFLARLTAAGMRVAARAEVRGRAAVIARLLRDLPELTAAADPAGVRVTAPSLRARAFGTRRRERDPRLAAIVEGLR